LLVERKSTYSQELGVDFVDDLKMPWQ